MTTMGEADRGFTARLVYTEPMLCRAVATFMKRRVVRGPIGLLGALCLIAALSLDVNGSTGLVFDATIAMLALIGILVVAIWRAHLAATIGKFHALNSGEAVFVATGENAAFRSGEGATTLPWRAFVEVWGIGDCWMLFTAPAQFVTIPLRGLNQDARTFLAGKLPRFKMHRPDLAAGHLTELEALAIAIDAAEKAHPNSMMALSMGFVTLREEGDRRTWSIASHTIGSQLIVDIDDASGIVRSIRSAGVR